MWYKFLEATSPSEPFMGCALRFIKYDINSDSLQVVGHLLGSKVLIRSASHKEIMDLLVELVGIGKYTVETSLYIHPKDGPTEGTQI